MEITAIHTLWPEKQGFFLERKYTESEYIFIHFLSSAQLKTENVQYSVENGACILYRPYSYRYLKAQDCNLLHDWFHATGDIEKLAKKYNLKFNELYYPHDDKKITEIIQQIEIEKMTNRVFRQEIINLKIDELFTIIARSAYENSKNSIVSADTYRHFMKVRTQMQTQYNKIENIEDLAAMVRLSPSRFYTIYRQVFGISPKQDLINIRIEHAKQLLLQQHYQVSNIAQMVGYNNQYHFIRQFKAVTGITPGKYFKYTQ